MIGQFPAIDPASERKAKQAVVTVSGLLLLFSNVTLLSNTMSLFGLEVDVSQEKIVAVLKLALGVATIALVMAYLEQLPRRIARLKRYWDEEKWWPPIEKDIAQYHRDMRGDDGGHYEPDWDDLAWSARNERKRKRQVIAGYTRPIVIVTRTISYYVWPLFLAAIALFKPSLVFVFV